MQRRVLATLTLVAALVLGPATLGAQGRPWGEAYFANLSVVSHDGKELRFYDDLIKGKIFLISFIFTSCRDMCPLATARLAELQAQLGDSMGRDIFFYSLSIDPDTDTPERLRQYAETFGAGPGWLFLTGTAADINAIRYKLGDRSRVLSEHRNEVLLGNGVTGRWARNNVLGDLRSLALSLRAMDPAWRPPAGGLGSEARPLQFDLTAEPGRALYRRLCAGCHSVGDGDKVGPDLAGVLARRDRDWLLRFISDPERMRAANDPVAMSLAAKFPAVRMPSLAVAPTDAADLLAYIDHLQRQQEINGRPLGALSALLTHTGARFGPAIVAGVPVAVFFGFTHCPDVCPTALLDWSNVLSSLGADGDRLKVLFVSVDSERDTPAALTDYLASFDRRILGLTGGAAELAAAARAFDAFHEQRADGFDHSSKTYLIGRDGRLAATLDQRTTDRDRRQVLERLLQQR